MYIYGDYCTGNIWGASGSGTEWTARLLINSSLFISSFGEDANGEIYVTDHRSIGGVYHLVDTAPLMPRRRAVAH
jgi:hypothetical protein